VPTRGYELNKTRWTLSIIAILLLGVFFGVNAQPNQAPQSRYENISSTARQFKGAWLPDIKSEKIGAENYKTLTNLRPIGEGIEGVAGYSKINPTINNADYLLPRSGIHFKKDYPPESHVLAQFYNYDGTMSKVYDNQTPIPNQGNFDVTELHTDASPGTFTGTYGQETIFADIKSTTGTLHKTKFVNIASSTGTAHETKFEDINVAAVITSSTPRARFSKGPQGHVIYSNAVESQIWGGNETRTGVFILSSSNVTEYVINPQDYTRQINNEYDTSLEVVTIDASGGTAYFLVGSPRALAGVSFYVKTANATAGAFVKFSEWSGTTWTALAETDGTNGLANDGQVSFPSTVDTSIPKYMGGQVLDWYVGALSAGSAVIYNVKLNVPWQDLQDRWDQKNRTPTVMQISRNGVYKDMVLEVNEGSSELFPITAEVGGLTSSDHMIIGFSDRIQAIDFRLLSGNTNAFGPNTTVSYWDGSAYVASGVTYDHTGDGETGYSGVTPLGKSGVLSWSPPNHEDEFQQYQFGQTAYLYKVKYGGTLGGVAPLESAVRIDRVYGITAPYKLYNFKFPAYHLNRVFLFGYLKGNQANRVDVCQANSPDVWNGRDSSDNGRQSIWIDGGEEVIAAKAISNRFGSQIYNMLVVFKRSEIYTVLGDSPDLDSPTRFKVNEVSTDLGLPAPFTLTSIEIGYVMSPNQPERNILAWLSASGPYIFDGSFPKPLNGINSYFDPNDDKYVGADKIEDAFAWYDPIYTEWNLRVADLWFAYNFTEFKWYLKDTGAAEDLQMAIPVVDTKGNKYIYAGIDTGFMMRLENGTDWDGTPITQTVETGDFHLVNNAWNETELRRIMLSYRVIDEDATLQVTHYANTSESGTSVMSVGLSNGSLIANRKTDPLDEVATWHRLKFEVSTSTSVGGFQPLEWGTQENLGFKREDRR